MDKSDYQAGRNSISSVPGKIFNTAGAAIRVSRRALSAWYHQLLPGKFIVFSILLLAGVLAIHAYFQSFFYVVSIDGREVGLIEDKEELEYHLRDLKERMEEIHDLEITVEEDIEYQREYRSGAVSNAREVKEAFLDLTFVTLAYAVGIEGEEVALVESKEAFEEIKEKVIDQYTPDSDNRTLMEADIQEEVRARRIRALPDEILTVERAVETVLGGSDSRKVHTVSRGETLSSIARENNLSVRELEENNPQVDSRSLRVGQEVQLIYNEPLLTVETVEEVTTQESIPYPVEISTTSNLFVMQREIKERGSRGKKEVTYRVTSQNGQEVEREKIGEVVLEEPTPQKEVRGTARSPSRATGPFLWPVQGGGILTQLYHSNHRAVDIASRRGTPIRAAYGGEVVRVRRYAGAAGHYIVLRHRIGSTTYYTRYLHNHSNLVSEGDRVSRGEVIAEMGDTGRATGVHLHFEIRRGGSNWQRSRALNPLNYFAP